MRNKKRDENQAIPMPMTYRSLSGGATLTTKPLRNSPPKAVLHMLGPRKYQGEIPPGRRPSSPMKGVVGPCWLRPECFPQSLRRQPPPHGQPAQTGQHTLQNAEVRLIGSGACHGCTLDYCKAWLPTAHMKRCLTNDNMKTAALRSICPPAIAALRGPHPAHVAEAA